MQERIMTWSSDSNQLMGFRNDIWVISNHFNLINNSLMVNDLLEWFFSNPRSRFLFTVNIFFLMNRKQLLIPINHNF